MELIRLESYRDCCDVIYEDSIPDDKTVVLCPTPLIDGFFDKIRGTNNRYILISNNHDVGICEHNGIIHKQDNVNMGNPIDVPSNIIKWYCTNANIRKHYIEPIPLGLPDWSFNVIKNMKISKEYREYCIYFNMTIHPYYKDRHNLVHLYQNCPECKFYANAHGTIGTRTIEQYIADLQKSYSSVCLSGNGLDCYRVLEALYSGAFPLFYRVEPWQKAYSNCPYIQLNGNIKTSNLTKRNYHSYFNLENTKADMMYWRDSITKSRELLI